MLTTWYHYDTDNNNMYSIFKGAYGIYIYIYIYVYIYIYTHTLECHHTPYADHDAVSPAGALLFHPVCLPPLPVQHTFTACW